jgi:hypothetical protein
MHGKGSNTWVANNFNAANGVEVFRGFLDSLERYIEYTVPGCSVIQPQNARSKASSRQVSAILTSPLIAGYVHCSILHLCLHHPLAG